MRAVERGDAAEDRSRGHAFAHNPITRAIQERFVTYAKRDLSQLRLVLRSSGDAAHRALAALVLGYAPYKQAVVEDLVNGISDPADEVRNNAMRSLLVFADMDPAAASRQVRQLEDDGLVERAGTPGDGRVTVVSLTVRGRTVERRMAAVRANHMADVLDHWSSADLTELGALLDRFVADLRAARYRPVEEKQTA